MWNEVDEECIYNETRQVHRTVLEGVRALGGEGGGWM